jgi:hypothetical protein
METGNARTRKERRGRDGKAGQTGTWQRRVTGHTTDRDCLPSSPRCRSVAFLPPFSPPHCCPVAAVVYVVKGASCPASSGQVEPPSRHASGDQSPLVSPCGQGRQPSPLPPLLAPSLSMPCFHHRVTLLASCQTLRKCQNGNATHQHGLKMELTRIN